MPKVIVKFPQQQLFGQTHDKHLLFQLAKGETLIGRGEDCALRLPNVSVSRQHCRIMAGNQNTTIEDMDSQNGLLVNGQSTKQHVLRSGDEVQVGKFSLIYLTDTSKDRFYQGRFVEYMPPYDADAMARALMAMENKATTVMNPDAIAKMANENHLVDHARIVSLKDATQFWHPGEKDLTFGDGGMVAVEGWFTFGVVAHVSWDGVRHFLHKQAWWVTVEVGGKSAAKMPLVHGAKFTIGGSRFRYEAPPLPKGA